MHLLFLDESNTPPKPKVACGVYFVIAGLIIPEQCWHRVDRQFSAVKNKYNVTGEIKWRFFGVENNDKSNSVNHLSIFEKDELRHELYNIITNNKDLSVIACVTSAEAAYDKPSIKSPDDLYHFTYKGMTERFQYYLQDKSKIEKSKQFGIIISDHRMNSDDEKLRGIHNDLIYNRKSNSSQYNNIIESIHFAPSHFSSGLQLVDLIAGAVHRAFRAKDSKWFQAIEPAFRRSPNDHNNFNGFGLVRLPANTFIEPDPAVG